MAHVHCGAQQGECFRIAGELCPSGYEMQPVMSGSDGNFLVRCRAAIAQAPTGSSHVTAATVASQDRWPPATEPWPAAYPWPPPETNVTAHAPSKPPSAPEGDFDIGY